MEDRVIEGQYRAEENIRQAGYGWYLDGENEEYLSGDLMMVSKQEIEHFIQTSQELYQLYLATTQHVQKFNLWSQLGINDAMIPLMEYDIQRNVPHILGRLDLAGGIEGTEIKMIEFNADTATLLPESAYFQSWIHEPLRLDYKGQHNFLIHDLSQVFRQLKNKFSQYPPTLLLTSLGYVEDKLNIKVLEEAAVKAGFEVAYADLQEVTFSEEGVFLESEEGYTQYHFMYKLIPWEFIMDEEPELLEILTQLSQDTGLVVLNPAYTLAMQSKYMMCLMHELYPEHKNLLESHKSDVLFQGKRHVRKVNFGRLGENIKVIAANGKTVSKSGGDFGHYGKMYQEFTPLYADEDGDLYQAGMYMCDGKASCLSFRRRDGLIIDDDSEFIGHVLF